MHLFTRQSQTCAHSRCPGVSVPLFSHPAPLVTLHTCSREMTLRNDSSDSRVSFSVCVARERKKRDARLTARESRKQQRLPSKRRQTKKEKRCSQNDRAKVRERETHAVLSLSLTHSRTRAPLLSLSHSLSQHNDTKDERQGTIRERERSE